MDSIAQEPHVIFFDRQWRAFRAKLLRQKRIAEYTAVIAECAIEEASPDPIVAAWARQRKAMYIRWLQEEQCRTTTPDEHSATIKQAYLDFKAKRISLAQFGAIVRSVRPLL